MLAKTFEDMDLSELIEPLLAPVLANSVVAAIPGFAQVAGLVTTSCVDGIVNAFLTLRIGCLASGYCSSVVKATPRLGKMSHLTSFLFAHTREQAVKGHFRTVSYAHAQSWWHFCQLKRSIG